MADLLEQLANSRDDCEAECADYIAKLLDQAIVEIERLRAIANTTAQMRTSQKAWFKEHKQSDLIASKQHEKDVDDRLARLKRQASTNVPPPARLL